MFLTEKRRRPAVVVPLFPGDLSQSHTFPFDFDAALSSLLPIPTAPAEHCLPWLSRASHLLSLTLSHALHLSATSPSPSPSPSLDSITLALLHSCNALSALSHSLLRRLLLLRFSLRSPNPTVDILPQKNPLPLALPELTTPRLPHGKIDPVQNAICAVEAVSALVIGAIWVTLTGKGAEQLKALNPVDAEVFPWGKEFNVLLEAVLRRIWEEEEDPRLNSVGAGSVDAQLEKMEEEVMMMVNGEKEGGLERIGVEEMEACCEEMREGLETLEAAVNSLFQAALCARNATPGYP